MVDYIFEPFMNWMIKIWYLSSIFRSKTSELCVPQNYNINPGKSWSILLTNCTNMYTFWTVGLFPHGGQKFTTVPPSPRSAKYRAFGRLHYKWYWRTLLMEMEIKSHFFGNFLPEALLRFSTQASYVCGEDNDVRWGNLLRTAKQIILKIVFLNSFCSSVFFKRRLWCTMMCFALQWKKYILKGVFHDCICQKKKITM